MCLVGFDAKVCMCVQNERRSVFQDLCTKVSKIWAELEVEPHGYFSLAAANRDKSSLVLSTGEINKMNEAYKQVSAIDATCPRCPLTSLT